MSDCFLAPVPYIILLWIQSTFWHKAAQCPKVFPELFAVSSHPFYSEQLFTINKLRHLANQCISVTLKLHQTLWVSMQDSMKLYWRPLTGSALKIMPFFKHGNTSPGVFHAYLGEFLEQKNLWPILHGSELSTRIYFWSLFSILTTQTHVDVGTQVLSLCLAFLVAGRSREESYVFSDPFQIKQTFVNLLWDNMFTRFSIK